MSYRQISKALVDTVTENRMRFPGRPLVEEFDEVLRDYLDGCLRRVEQELVSLRAEDDVISSLRAIFEESGVVTAIDRGFR